MPAGAEPLKVRLCRHHSGPAAFDRERFQGRNVGLGIGGVADDPHAHLHARWHEIYRHIAATAAIKEMNMRIVGE